MMPGYIFILGLVWGSFLNMVGYRILQPELFKKSRSFCPHCLTPLVWYDLIPLISWIILHARCRFCAQPISMLYPFIEVVSAASLTALWYTVPIFYFPAYFIFFSTLIVTIRTDFEWLLISRFVTSYLIPGVFLASYLGYLPVTLAQSMTGACFGYAILYLVQQLFVWATGKQGMGDGDLELLAYIGAFTGIFGAWTTLVISSVLGTCIGSVYLLATKQKESIFPFGPSLAFAAMAYILYTPHIIKLYAFMAS